MTSSPTSAETPDLRDAVIADAATRLGMLRRLADLGMRLAEEVCERAVSAPYHPEPRHEPARAFANVSRSVRLTLVLMEKVEARLVALRNGATVIMDDVAAMAPARRGSGADMGKAAAEDGPGDTAEGPERSRETLREREGERFDDLVSGPFEDCVATIRAGLGLKPGDDIPADDDSAEAALGNVLEAASARRAVDGALVSAISIASTAAEAPHPPNTG